MLRRSRYRHMTWPRRNDGVYHSLPKGTKGTPSMMAVPPHHSSVDYTGLAATAWELFSTDEAGPDDAFFRGIVAQFGEPALDIGCGSGRLLVPMIVLAPVRPVRLACPAH